MKKLITFLSICFPALLISQKYEFKADQLLSGCKGGSLSLETHKIDKSKSGWESEAKLILNELDQAQYTELKVSTYATPPERINALTGSDYKNSVFDLSDAIKKNNTMFQIEYNKQKCTISFEVTGDGDRRTSGDSEDETFNSYIGALANANFVGNNKFLSNLTPIVNLGSVTTLVSGKEWFTWKLDANPYVGAEIDTKDSASFIPALMLYGRGGLILNNYLNFRMGKTSITLMPFGFGLKFLPNLQDSGKTVIQHNIRGGLALKYSNIFILSTQLTRGWHNLTSQSDENFADIIGGTSTRIDYITVTGQFALNGKTENVTNYVYLEWRNLLSKDRYASFTNNSILTFGVRKTLELGSFIFPASDSPGKRNNRRKVHMNL